MSGAERIIERLSRNKLQVATAESCTGGLLAGALTAVPGASDVFGCGVVSYSNEMKIKLLKVKEDTLSVHGAVSRETAEEMAQGVRHLAGANFGLATTGIAGPGGGSAAKPVGLVYIALSDARGVIIEKNIFSGDRNEIRKQTVAAVLDMLEQRLNELNL